MDFECLAMPATNGICLNLPHLFLLRMVVGVAFAYICYFYRVPKAIFFTVFAILWITGLGHSPYSNPGYFVDYLENFHFYDNELLGASNAPSQSAADIGRLEGIGWQILYFIHRTVNYGWGLQAFCGLIQIGVFWFLLRVMHIRPREKMLVLILFLFSTPFTLATDWYLRQGLSWAVFMLALAFLKTNMDASLRLTLFLFMCAAAIIFHLSIFVFIVGFALGLLIARLTRRCRRSRNLSTAVIIFWSLIISFIIIFPFRSGLVNGTDVLSTLLSSSVYVKKYARSEWGPAVPGGAIILYLVLTSISYPSDMLDKNRAVNFGIYIMLFFVTCVAAVGMLTSSLASRLLFPFFIYWVAILFAGLRFKSARNSLALVNLAGIAIISHTILTVIVQNGGVPR